MANRKWSLQSTSTDYSSGIFNHLYTLASNEHRYTVVDLGDNWTQATALSVALQTTAVTGLVSFSCFDGSFGVRQVETLTFSGTATGTSAVVDGITINFPVGASAVFLANIFAYYADQSKYSSVTQSGAVVTLTRKHRGLTTAIAGGSSAGITWAQATTVVGASDGNTGDAVTNAFVCPLVATGLEASIASFPIGNSVRLMKPTGRYLKVDFLNGATAQSVGISVVMFDK